MFLMMTNGFGCILGGMVGGKVVEHFTLEGITDWQTDVADFRRLFAGSGFCLCGAV